MKLDLCLVKNLVQDIEGTDRTRKSFNLPKLVAEKAHTYGAEGSEKRRAVQKKFDQLKRKSPQEYRRFLDRLEVTPGEGLQREIRNNSNNNNTVIEIRNNNNTEIRNNSSSTDSGSTDSEQSDGDLEEESDSDSDTKQSTSTKVSKG